MLGSLRFIMAHHLRNSRSSPIVDPAEEKVDLKASVTGLRLPTITFLPSNQKRKVPNRRKKMSIGLDRRTLSKIDSYVELVTCHDGLVDHFQCESKVSGVCTPIDPTTVRTLQE